MDPAYEEVISCFYEAALDSSRWAAGMARLAEVAGAQAALSMRANVHDPGAAILENVGNDPDVLQQYEAYYNKLDPMYAVAAETRPGAWLNDWKLVGPGLARTEWYNDFCRPAGTHAVLSNLVYSHEGRMASVSIQRFTGAPAFTDDDERRLAPLVPHLRRAAELFFSVERLRARDGLARTVLDNLHLAVWVLEGDGSILLSNAPAERAVRSPACALRVRGGKVESAGGDPQWERALRLATQPRGTRGSCLLLRGSLGACEPVMVAPCAAASPWGSAWQRPVAVVVMPAPGGRAPDLQQALGALYGFTAAETRVACAIAEGLSPAEIAEQWQTSVQTTRTQLKAVYSKAGVRRQAELVRVVGRLRMVGVQ